MFGNLFKFLVRETKKKKSAMSAYFGIGLKNPVSVGFNLLKQKTL